MTTVIKMKGAESAPANARSGMETLIITPSVVAGWKIPPFQRPLRVNEKVRATAEEIKKTETIPGIITLGRLKDQTLHLVDGQHRVEAFKISELREAIADVRVVRFDTVGEMADEFVQLNSSLVKMRPDDILRGMEQTTSSLRAIRAHCPYVGYDNLRRNESTPILGMSMLIRAWNGSQKETPVATSGPSAAILAETMEPGSVQTLLSFLDIAYSAWGRDPEYYRLWNALNLVMCMWLYTRLVHNKETGGTRRHVSLTQTMFKHCLMALSADADYLQWLQGRAMTDRDRAPAYSRISAIFRKRMKEHDVVGKMPGPAWAN